MTPKKQDKTLKIVKILVVSATQNLTISLPNWLVFEDVMNNILASKKVK